MGKPTSSPRLYNPAVLCMLLKMPLISTLESLLKQTALGRKLLEESPRLL